MILRRCLFVLLIEIMPIFLIAQVEKQKPVLHWDFFKNDKPNGAIRDAITTYSINYKYYATKISGTSIKLSFNISLDLDTAKSYYNAALKFKSDALLKHEQGHVDIGFMHAAKLDSILKQTSFSTMDYRKKIESIFQEVLVAMKAENRQYDEETSHGTNPSNQEKWNSYLKVKTPYN
jgi:hypothetical protein